MKKLAISAVAAALLSTTALAEVTISGTSEFYYKNDDSQITANNGDSMGTTDNEIIITFSKKNDTGLEFGIVTELYVTTDSSTTTDESYMYISGSAGKLVLGGNDAVTDNFGIGEDDIMDEEVTGTYTSATIGALNAGEKSYGADLIKVSYFTPAIGGLTAGVSYYDSGATGTSDSTSFGLGYAFGDIKIGYTNGTEEVSGAIDNKSQNLGAKLALGNATFIAAVSKVEGADEDIDSIGFGASYKVNDTITIAASTLNSEDSLDLSGTEKEELTQHSFEIKYQIAPGLAGYVNYTDYDYKNGGEASTDDNGAVTQFKIAASF
jgi:outer membrane protein OmpU